MRDRLASLSDEARSIRAQVPHEFEPDVERIQQQMQRLGERLSELSSGVVSGCGGGGAEEYRCESDAHAARAEPEEVILLGGPSNADDPWDQQSANALTRFYESGEAYFGCAREAAPCAGPQAAAPAPGAPAWMLQAAGPQSAGGAPSSACRGEPGEEERTPAVIEPAWLDRRFAEIAQRIEQSLAEIRPESSLLTLGRRFDQLEARMTSALRGVATRADIEELRIAESQIEQISAQLDQLRRQLARLDAIDAHLGTLAAQLSDERIASVFRHGAGTGPDAARLEAIDTHLATIADQLSYDRLADLISQSVGRSADLEGLAAAAAQKTAARIAGEEARSAQTRDIGEVRGLLESLINERRHNDENNASMLETMQQAIIRVLDRIDALELAQQGAVAPPAARPVPPQAQPDTERARPDLQSGEMQAGSDYEAPQAAPFGQFRDEPLMAPRPQAPFATAPFDLDAAFARGRDAGAERFGAPEPPPARAMDVLRHDFIADAHRAKLKAASRKDCSADLGDARMGESASAMEKPAPQKARARRSIFNIRSPRVLMSILTLLAMIPAALFFMPRSPSGGAKVPAAEHTLPLSDEHVPGSGGMGTKGVAPGSPNGKGADSPANGMPSKQSRQSEPGAQPSPGEYEDVGSPAREAAAGRVDTAALPADRMAAASATPASIMQESVLRMNGVGAAEISTDDGKSVALPPATVGPYSLRLAAAQGEPSAQFEVAVRLAEGKGTEQDLKKAAEWYQRSAANGFAMAQFRLGTLYERGVGVTRDLARAQVWYTRAAEQGNVKAMHNLAVLIAGRGGQAPDYSTAAKWFAEAAERGLPDSQYNLAVLYENGLGVAKDVKAAYRWLLLAARSDDSEAKSRRDTLKAKLGAEDRAAAEALARAFRAKPTDPMANNSRIAGQAWRQYPQRSTSG
jgi:localization factor PodJL